MWKDGNKNILCGKMEIKNILCKDGKMEIKNILCVERWK